REPVLLRDARAELDPEFPGDRTLVERGGSIMAVPLIFGERVGGVLGFTKRQPHWFDEGDVEFGAGIAVYFVLAIEHQRLAKPPGRGLLGRRQLRGAARDAQRVGALRARAWRLPGRRQAHARPLRGGRGGHTIPRRDRRAGARRPSQAPARPPGAPVRACRG